MPLPCSNSALRLLAALAMAGVLSVGSWAQEPAAETPAAQAALPAAPQPATAPASFQDYSKPRPAFPNVIAPYMPQQVPPPNLSNTPRIELLLQDGKLMLCLLYTSRCV